MRASAATCAGSRPRPEIGKFSTARWVWARYRASAGTRTSPMVSRSIRKSLMPPSCQPGPGEETDAEGLVPRAGSAGSVRQL